VSDFDVPREGDQEWTIARVGSEPVVLWGEGEDGLPRWSVAAPGWRFESREVVELHDGAMIAGTPLEEFDIERDLTIAGFTLADLRAVARESARESWWRRLRRRVRA
jgi:hypothetical protein